jgi:hypothetical protein
MSSSPKAGHAQDIAQWEAAAGAALPDVLRALYLIHDGQSTVEEIEDGATALAHGTVPRGYADDSLSPLEAQVHAHARIMSRLTLGALGFLAVYDGMPSAHISPLTYRGTCRKLGGHSGGDGQGSVGLLFGQRIDQTKSIIINLGNGRVRSALLRVQHFD